MRALITGSEGFVGRYLREELNKNGYEVFGVDVVEAQNCVKVDMLDYDRIEKAISDIQPDFIFNLAGQADVARSWREPKLTFQLNVIATINLLEAVRKSNCVARIVLVGSSDEYGVLRERGISVSETTTINPVTPYAISKVAQEQMAKTYVEHYGMDICMTRSFNHAGPGQKKGFMIADFASGIVDVEKGKSKFLSVGNLESARDYTHVKDIAKAYRLIAERGKNGEVYNVGSGKAYKAQAILDKLVSMANMRIEIKQDKRKLRPSDTPIICCDNTKIKNDINWVSTIEIDELLKDTLSYWRNRNEKNSCVK